MTWWIWMGLGCALLLGAGAWALLRGGRPEKDLGTISGQWIADHRGHERETENP